MATATIPGISTLGVTFSVGYETTSGAKPTSFEILPRCNDIAEITLETETIDASALEDMTSRYIAGRADTGGTWDVTFNLTNETIPILQEMLETSNEKLATNLRTWFQISSPYLTDSFFVVGQPGTKIPLPAIAQNELLTGAISIAIDEYIGTDTKVEPTAGE